MPRTVRSHLSLLLAALLLTAGVPAVRLAAAAGTDNCFWRSRSSAEGGGVAYPDKAATYYSLAAVLPPGASLVLRGRYPHARYASYNVYDPALRPADGLADVDLQPDRGSLNPFRVGARRDGAHRTYTVTVVAGAVPARRATNTLYANASGVPDSAIVLLYRVYVPDRGLGPDGGVGQPSVSMRLATGRELTGPDACQVGNGTSRPNPVPGANGPTDPAGVVPATNPVIWHRFTDLPSTETEPYFDVLPDAHGAARPPRTGGGGFLSNHDNAYVTAVADRAFGRLLVLTGTAPSVPRTQAGARVMPAGQVRYWSLCTNEQLSTRFIDCAYDQQIPIDVHGQFTVVVSTPADRPRAATTACGVAWLAWGPQPQALVILRDMLPAPTFRSSIQRAAPGAERSTMGSYLPVGRSLAPTAFRSPRCG